MGLGLAMVKNIVETYDGQIEVESSTSKGTSFFRLATFRKFYGMKYKTLKVKTQKRLGWITINRPKKLNALNRETLSRTA
jgi:hypothetical protein